MARPASRTLLTAGVLVLMSLVSTSAPPPLLEVPRAAAMTAGPDPAPRPAPPASTRMPAPGIPRAAPTRLRIAAVGLDARVVEDPSVPGSTIDPASWHDVSWLSTYGTPGTDAVNTVYLAGHSSDRQGTVFDALLEDTGRGRDLTGQAVTLTTHRGRLTYRIDGPARRIDKAAIATDRQVWAVVPGRLVLVTCDQDDEDANVVLTATLASWTSRIRR